MQKQTKQLNGRNKSEERWMWSRVEWWWDEGKHKQLLETDHGDSESIGWDLDKENQHQSIKSSQKMEKLEGGG